MGSDTCPNGLNQNLEQRTNQLALMTPDHGSSKKGACPSLPQCSSITAVSHRLSLDGGGNALVMP